MRRSILLILSVALAVLVFAPIAAAQSDDMGGFSLVPILSAAVLALLIGSGVIATVLVRRAS